MSEITVIIRGIILIVNAPNDKRESGASKSLIKPNETPDKSKLFLKYIYAPIKNGICNKRPKLCLKEYTG